MTAIADAKAGEYLDRNGDRVQVYTLEQTEQTGAYGFMVDGPDMGDTIHNPDYFVFAPHIDAKKD